MYFTENQTFLTAQSKNETIRIESCGKNAFRVRVTQNVEFTGENHVLSYDITASDITIGADGAEITNGKIRCFISNNGYMTFFKDDTPVLKEYARDFSGANEHSPSLHFPPREFKSAGSSDYDIKLRFEANEGEKIYGMGQYQQPNLDLKGCILELAQRNSQISVPFYLSSRNYGFLWNNPSIGDVVFGNNYTQWHSRLSEELDFWITVDDTPKKIVENYTAVTGRAPEFPENALGLWQSKLRYRTQKEVLDVATEYKKRGIPLDVIVIDYFHWIRQGDWSFDPQYWPNPKEMTDILKQMGIKCMVSVWPTVDKKSINFDEMNEKGLLVRTERGTYQCLDFFGSNAYYDALNPKAREFIWSKVKENYFENGIDMFWLDVAEPEYIPYDHDHYRHYTGPALKVGNSYPMYHAKTFYDGLKSEKKTDIVNLIRSAWVGSQKYGAIVWSGDIKSNFTALRDQLSAGLNIGIAGIPWWTTDTGGFFDGDIHDPDFTELLIRWFQFSVFSPVLRMHGDRLPHDIPPLSKLDFGGGSMHTGSPNELWSYGEEAYKILKKYLDLRLDLKKYIKSVMDEASQNGSPVIRTMFYEFPDDPKCWEVNDQYMFGSEYLVAPVLYPKMTEREVYLPSGKWKNIHNGEMQNGGRIIKVAAPIDIIPVYQRY